MKKKIYKENMEEIDTTICLKKINKDLKNTKKIIIKQKNQQKLLIFGKQYSELVLRKPISVEKVEIKKQSCLKQIHMTIKVHLNILLDI